MTDPFPVALGCGPAIDQAIVMRVLIAQILDSGLVELGRSAILIVTPVRGLVFAIETISSAGLYVNCKTSLLALV